MLCLVRSNLDSPLFSYQDDHMWASSQVYLDHDALTGKIGTTARPAETPFKRLGLCGAHTLTPQAHLWSLYRCSRSAFINERPVGHGRRNKTPEIRPRNVQKIKNKNKRVQKQKYINDSSQATEFVDPEGVERTAQLNPNWKAYYQAAMEEAPAMVFCLSEAWCRSQWCEQELIWYVDHRRSPCTRIATCFPYHLSRGAFIIRTSISTCLHLLHCRRRFLAQRTGVDMKDKEPSEVAAMIFQRPKAELEAHPAPSPSPYFVPG